jgi:hypothetical protein
MMADKWTAEARTFEKQNREHRAKVLQMHPRKVRRFWTWQGVREATGLVAYLEPWKGAPFHSATYESMRARYNRLAEEANARIFVRRFLTGCVTAAALIACAATFAHGATIVTSDHIPAGVYSLQPLSGPTPQPTQGQPTPAPTAAPTPGGSCVGASLDIALGNGVYGRMNQVFAGGVQRTYCSVQTASWRSLRFALTLLGEYQTVPRMIRVTGPSGVPCESTYRCTFVNSPPGTYTVEIRTEARAVGHVTIEPR